MINREVVVNNRTGFMAVDDGLDGLAEDGEDGSLRIGYNSSDLAEGYTELYITREEWEELKIIGDEFFENKRPQYPSLEDDSTKPLYLRDYIAKRKEELDEWGMRWRIANNALSRLYPLSMSYNEWREQEEAWLDLDPNKC